MSPASAGRNPQRLVVGTPNMARILATGRRTTVLLVWIVIATATLTGPPPADAVSRSNVIASQSSADTPAWIAAIAEGVTALSVLLLLWQIRDSRNASKGERTSAIQERYQSDEFFSSASRTVGCTAVRDAGDCIDL